MAFWSSVGCFFLSGPSTHTQILSDFSKSPCMRKVYTSRILFLSFLFLGR